MSDPTRTLRIYWSEITADLTQPTLDAAHLHRTIVATAPDQPLRRSAWGMVMMTLIGALILGGTAWLLRPGAGPTPLADTPRPSDMTGVFRWHDHDLHEWVTEHEMADALESVLNARSDDGRAHTNGSEKWTYVVDGRTWTIFAHSGDHDGDGLPDATPGRIDPRLPDGATYEPADGFAHGFYLLTGPHSDEVLCMKILPPAASIGYPSAAQLSTHEDRMFMLASVMLREMGWAD